MLDRRSFLAAGGAAAALAALGLPEEALAANGLQLSQPTPFSFDALVAQAKTLAGKPYVAAAPLAPDVLERIDYDAHGKIRFKPEMALWANGPSPVAGDLLPPRPLLPEAGPHACAGEHRRQGLREIIYDESYFEMPADSAPPASCRPARALPASACRKAARATRSQGRKLDWQKNDWVAFLGASYFRAIGELYQYGLSARGLALDPAVAGKAEEFPDFTHIWLRDAASRERTPRDGLRAARGAERGWRLSLP
jgi:glucans biosynthesis protein